MSVTDTFVPLELDLSSLTPGPHTLTLQVRLLDDASKVWTDALTETLSVVVDVP